MKDVFIIIFKNLTIKDNKILIVRSTERKAINYCNKFAMDNPSYKLTQSKENQLHWHSNDYKFALSIEKIPFDE